MRDKLKPLRNHSPKLFTASIDKMLFKQFPMGNDLSKQMVVAKIVNPFGFGNWYLLNSDPNDPDYIWAIVDYEIVDIEIGSVSRKELENEKLYSYNGDETTLQRDLNFTPVNAKKLYDGLLKGKYYGHGGTTKRPLHVIAAEIRADWKNVYFGAKPYLDAMSTMNSIDDNYGMDDGRSIVNYFLANASTWRGETAKRVKAELKEMAKYYHGGSVHKKKYSSGGIAGESARVKNLSDEFASDELKDKLRKAIGIEGDVLQETDTPVIAFAFTDYGGDFYDKIAIAYFSEYYPDNTLVEPTSYSGYNAFVFGKPAQDYIEQTENYLLGFEDMETLYYEAQRHEEEEAFDDFIQDLNDEKYLFDEDMVKDWLMQNRTGYYSMTTTGLDYSSSELTDTLLEQGLLIEDFGILLDDLSNDGYMFDDDELEQYIRENIEAFIALVPFDMYYEDIVSLLLKDGIISEEENYAKGGMFGAGHFANGGKISKSLKEKYANLNYQIQNADMGWIKNNPEKYEDMIRELQKLHAKIYRTGRISKYAEGGNLKKQEWVAIFQHQEKWYSQKVISVYANTEKEAIREAEMSRNSNGISKEYELVNIYTYSGNPPMGFAKGGKLTTEPKVGDVLIMKSNGKKGIVVKCGQDQCDVDFGYGDVYGIVYGRIKDGIIYDRAFAEGGNVGALTENEIKRINDTMEYYFYYLEDAKDYASRKNTDTKKLAKFVMYSGKISKEKENDVLKYITDRISTFAKGGKLQSDMYFNEYYVNGQLRGVSGNMPYKEAKEQALRKINENSNITSDEGGKLKYDRIQVVNAATHVVKFVVPSINKDFTLNYQGKEYSDGGKTNNKMKTTFAKGGKVKEWKQATTQLYTTKKEADRRLNIMKNHNESDTEYRDLRVEKLNDRFVIKFLFREKYAKGGKVNIIEGQDLGWEWKHENQELFRLFYDEAKTDYDMFYEKALKLGYSEKEIDDWCEKRNIDNTYDKGGSVNKAEWAAIFMNKQNPFKFVKVLVDANSIGEAIQQALLGALVHNMSRDYDLVDVYVVKGGRRTDTNYSKGAGYAKGGKIGFKGLSEKVAKRYVGQKVAPKYQKEYGKTYDKAEAKEVGNKVAAKVYRAQLSNKKSVIDTKTK